MTDQQPLKPCPFCGGETFKYDLEKDPQFGTVKVIRCKTISCQAGIMGKDDAENMAAWNRRADSETIKALEERIAGLAAALEEARDLIDDASVDALLETMTVERIDGVWDTINAAFRDSSPILARVRALAKAEAFEEATEIIKPYGDAYGIGVGWLRDKAAALRREAGL